MNGIKKKIKLGAVEENSAPNVNIKITLKCFESFNYYDLLENISF